MRGKQLFLHKKYKLHVDFALVTYSNQDNSCIFCSIVNGHAEASFIYRNEKVSAFLDIHPLFKGHVLIVPNTHFVDIRDVSEETLFEVMRVAKIVGKLVVKNLNADGVNVIHSTGRAAGQTIFHFHIHVLPRKFGDDTEFESWWFTRSHKASRGELDALAERINSSGD